jgi:hypothetical protein
MMTLQPTVSSRLRQLVFSCCARACLQLLLPEKSVLTLLIRHPKPRPADRHMIAFVVGTRKRSRGGNRLFC